MPTVHFNIEPYTSSTVISNPKHQVYADWQRTQLGAYIYNGVDAEFISKQLQGTSEKEYFGKLITHIAQHLFKNTSKKSLKRAEVLLPHLTQSGVIHQAGTSVPGLVLDATNDSSSGAAFPSQTSRRTTLTLLPSGKIRLHEVMPFEFPLCQTDKAAPVLESIVDSVLSFDEQDNFKVKITKSVFKSDDQALLNMLTSPITSAEMHNHNSLLYLEEIQSQLGKSLSDLPEDFKKILENTEVESRIIYTQLIKALNQYSHQENPLRLAETEAYNALLSSVYLNDNRVLNATYTQIASAIDSQTPSSSRNIANRVKSTFAHTSNGEEGITPTQQESALVRLKNTLGDEFHPMETTSIPSLRDTPWLSNVKQIRMGTQAIREAGESYVSPLFEKFIQSQVDPFYPAKITHLYINSLKRDIGSSMIQRIDERTIEAKFTTELEALEKKHPNLAVITLPSDGGYMSKEDALDCKIHVNSKKEILIGSQLTEFVKIAMESKGAKKGVKDFHISQSVRERAEIDETLMKTLLEKSAVAVGISTTRPYTPISPAQRQAIWFHFIKYELPNYLISKLKPETMNCSCKDGIDRGGVASAYFNLMKSFEKASPRTMTQDEFNRELHAAPTMVKGRGMNHHIHLIWNSVDAYVEANYKALSENNNQKWLIEWRDLNCPKERASDLLERNLKNLESYGAEPEVKPLVRNVLEQVKILRTEKSVKPSVLLEVLMHTRNFGSGDMNKKQISRLVDFNQKNSDASWFPSFRSIWESIKEVFRSEKSNITKQGSLKEHLHALEHSQPPKPAVVESLSDTNKSVPK